MSIEVGVRPAPAEDEDGHERPTSRTPGGAGALRWVAWQRPYALALVAFDAGALAVAGFLCQALAVDAGQQLPFHYGWYPYSLVGLVLIPLWLGVVALSGGYALRRVGNGSEEYRAVVVAGARLAALLCIFLVLNEMVVSRRFLIAYLVVGTALMVGDRYLARRWLHAQRRLGRALQPVVVVGERRAVRDLVRHLRRSSYAGLAVVGACVPDPAHDLGAVADTAAADDDAEAGDAAADGLARPDRVDVDGEAVPVVGSPEDPVPALAATGATVLAVTGGAELGADGLKRLAWALEGTGVDLIVAPELVDIAGPRIEVRPLSGLPLLAIDEPGLSGPARLVKGATDRLIAFVLLLVLSPLLLVVALLVKLTSDGPVLFRQERVGRAERRFQMVKFRTMVTTAEDDLADLRGRNEHDGLLFKMREDPRVTPVGKRLRRYSIDELPQLWHVLTGEMSLVGPRPPLPSEVEQYGDDTRRRLLVKPGMTGLWQVSGRADLPWDEAVRLDLYYVDSWSPALDLVILWKTVNAVVRGTGAY